MRAKLIDLTFSRDGESRLTISTREDLRALFDELHESEVDIAVKKYRQKRSLDANAYAWVLMDKLSEAVGRPKLDVYRDEIRNIGGNTDVVCVQDRAVERLRENWSKNGIGWITDTMPSRIDGCTNVILYYGSSTFDSFQMSRFIDNIIQDCKAVGVETLPPDKLAALVNDWG